MSNCEFSTNPEVKTGYITGETFNTQLVRYSVIDGMAVFEGDILLGTVEAVDAFTELIDSRDIARVEAAPRVAEAEREAGVVITGGRFRWRDGVKN